jgi:hypothetical protein
MQELEGYGVFHSAVCDRVVSVQAGPERVTHETVEVKPKNAMDTPLPLDSPTLHDLPFCAHTVNLLGWFHMPPAAFLSRHSIFLASSCFHSFLSHHPKAFKHCMVLIAICFCLASSLDYEVPKVRGCALSI